MTQPMTQPAMRMQNVNKSFQIGYLKNKQSVLAAVAKIFSDREQKKQIHVVDNVSIVAYPGEILGILGDNGSGKSTILRIIADIYGADSGTVEVHGKLISLINLGAALKERLTMKENIFMVGSLFGMSTDTIRNSLNSIADFAELTEFMGTKTYQFSSGMVQRLVFSVAIHASPDILLLDEVFEVGDENFKRKSAQKIQQLAEQKVCVLLVSHNLELIEKYCHRVIWLSKGKVVAEGATKDITRLYRQEKK